MGFGGISIWQLLIILAVVLLIFGSGKLKSLGSDLGAGLKGFKKAVEEDNGAEEIKKDVFNEMRMEELDGLEKQNKDS